MTPSRTEHRMCLNCGGREFYHIYSPPGYSSSDGLPTFEGCFHLGHRGDEDYPILICKCEEFLCEDDVKEMFGEGWEEFVEELKLKLESEHDR